MRKHRAVPFGSSLGMCALLVVGGIGCDEKKQGAEGVADGVTAPAQGAGATGGEDEEGSEVAMHEAAEERCELLSVDEIAELSGAPAGGLKTSRRVRGGDQVRCKVYKTPVSITMRFDALESAGEAKTRFGTFTRDRSAEERELVNKVVGGAADDALEEAGEEAREAVEGVTGETVLEQKSGQGPDFEEVELGCAGAKYKNGYDVMKMGGMESKSYFNALYLHEDNVFIALTVQIEPEDPVVNKKAALALGESICAGL